MTGNEIRLANSRRDVQAKVPYRSELQIIDKRVQFIWGLPGEQDALWFCGRNRSLGWKCRHSNIDDCWNDTTFVKEKTDV